MVVKVGKPRCNACRSVDPRFTALARSLPQHRFFSVNLAASPDIVRECDVELMPSIVIYRGGQQAHADLPFVASPRALSLMAWASRPRRLTRVLALATGLEGLRHEGRF